MLLYQAEINGPGTEMKWSRGIYYIWDRNIELELQKQREEERIWRNGFTDEMWEHRNENIKEAGK